MYSTDVVNNTIFRPLGLRDTVLLSCPFLSLTLNTVSPVSRFVRKMAINKDPSTPTPMIGKIGPYTVFITPPSTPTTSTEPPLFQCPSKVVARPPPPVQPPPQQFDKSLVASHSDGHASLLGYFKNAAFKVQNAHSSLDDHLARWFGLNQSKYQWALDDYYESNGLEKEGVKVKEISSKMQIV